MEHRKSSSEKLNIEAMFFESQNDHKTEAIRFVEAMYEKTLLDFIRSLEQTETKKTKQQY